MTPPFLSQPLAVSELLINEMKIINPRERRKAKKGKRGPLLFLRYWLALIYISIDLYKTKPYIHNNKVRRKSRESGHRILERAFLLKYTKTQTKSRNPRSYLTF